MDAHLDTLTDELCQVKTRVSHIARRQAHLNGFVESPSPYPEASDDNNSDNDDNRDEDASSPNDDNMST